MMNHEVFPQIVNHLDRVFAVPQIYGMIDFQSSIISSKWNCASPNSSIFTSLSLDTLPKTDFF